MSRAPYGAREGRGVRRDAGSASERSHVAIVAERDEEIEVTAAVTSGVQTTGLP